MQRREDNDKDVDEAFTVIAKPRIPSPLPPLPQDVVKLSFNQHASFSSWQAAAKTSKPFNLFVNKALMPARLLQEKEIILPQLIISCLYETAMLSFPRDGNAEKKAIFTRLLNNLKEIVGQYEADPSVGKYNKIILLISDLLTSGVCNEMIAVLSSMYDTVVIKRYAIITGIDKEVSIASEVWKECFRAYVNRVTKLEILMNYIRELREGDVSTTRYQLELNAILESKYLLIDRCRAQFMIALPTYSLKNNAEATFKTMLDGIPIQQLKETTIDNNTVDFKKFLFGLLLANVELSNQESYLSASSYCFRRCPEIFNVDESDFMIDAESNKIFYNPLYAVCQCICYQTLSGKGALSTLQYLEGLAIKLINHGHSLTSEVSGQETTLSMLENRLTNSKDEMHKIESKRIEIIGKLCAMKYGLEISTP